MTATSLIAPSPKNHRNKRPSAKPAAKPAGTKPSALNIREITAGARRLIAMADLQAYEKAVGYLQHLLRQSPSYSPAHAAIAEAYSLWGFRLELNGENSASYYNLAVEHAETALDISPELSETHRAAAVAYRRGPKADAVRRKEEILTALDLDSHSAENWYEYWRAFGYCVSDPAIRRALELNPHLCAAHIDYGVALCEEGRLAEARRHMEYALKLSPGNTLASYNLAMILSRMGLAREAASVVSDALKQRPDEPLLIVGAELVGCSGEFVAAAIDRIAHPSSATSAYAAS